MKQKKWLLILVIIVMIINVSFLILTRWAKVDEIVQNKLAAYLASHLEADVSIGSLSFNDKQLNISDLSISKHNQQYQISIKQIYVEYHLRKLLFSRFKDFSNIGHIRVYEPDIEWQILPSEKESENAFEIPDLQHYFQELTVYSGKFYVSYETDLIQVEEFFENLTATLQNTDKSIFNLTAENIYSGTLSIEAELRKNVIEQARIEWYDYKPTSLELSFFESFETKLNLQAVIQNNKLSYHGNLTETEIEVISNIAQSPLIQFEGNLDDFKANSEEIFFAENLITGKLTLTDYLTKEGKIHGDFQAESVNLTGFYERLEGIGEVDLKIRGNLSAPVVSGTAHCSLLVVENQHIRNIDARVEFFKEGARLSLTNAFWFDHRFYGQGNYFFDETLDFQLTSDFFQWYRNRLLIEGKAYAEIEYEDGFRIDLRATELEIKHPAFSLQNLQATAVLDKTEYQVELRNPAKNIHFSGTGNFMDSSYQAKLNFRRFNLDSFFSVYTLPMLSGSIELQSKDNLFSTTSSLRLYDKAFGKLDGRFTIDFQRDFPADSSYLHIDTHNMKFNYEDFDFTLSASGTADSLHTATCTINDEIDIVGWLTFAPSFDYKVKASATNISIPNYLKYVMDDYSARQFSGRTTFIMEYESHKERNFAGVVKVDRFRHQEMSELQANLQFYGTRSFISIPQLSIFARDFQIIGLEGDILLEPELSIKAVGKINDVELSKVFPNRNMEGLVNGDFLFIHENNDFIADLDLQAEQLNLFGVQADSLMLVCSQEKERLKLIKLKVEKQNQYSLQANGALGYTFWNSKTYQDTNHVNISFEGDLLNILANYFSGIQSAKSNSVLAMQVGIAENGLSINEGSFQLNNAELRIRNQVEIVDRIRINWEIINNELLIKECSFRKGEGRFYLTNEIDEDEDDFVLGMLNLGKFYARTDERGLLVHVPGYMPFNSVVNAEIRGRYDEYFKIIGPFDDMKFIGDIYVSNGGIMYPPDMDNILKLFGKITEERKDTDEIRSYPFSLDVMFHVKDNVRYVTYPASIMVTPGNFLHLQYSDDEFHVDNALFTSTEGSVNMFGTNLFVEQFDVQINPYFTGVHINGLLYKRAVDGTIITMEVFHNPMEKHASFLQFRLYSDNPNDSMLDVLAKLRYNRPLEEISDEEKKTLLQDEVVQLAGLGLESAILDPLIYPLENQIRRLLRLDLFHVQTGIIKNFFNRYYFEREEDKNYLLREELNSITKFGAEMFLNNLTIVMGKYLSRKFFLIYETKFEKPTDVAISSKLGINHSFTLRYDLPKRYKIAYRYKIIPFDEKNSHEIALERAFRFW